MMQKILRRIVTAALLGTVTAATALAQSPPPTPHSAKVEGQSEQSQKEGQQRVEQQDTVHPKNSKDDVEAIGCGWRIVTGEPILPVLRK